MVSQDFASMMKKLRGWDDVVGRKVIISEHSGNENKDLLTIVGVYRDIHLGSAENNGRDRPSVIFYGRAANWMNNYLLIQLDDFSVEKLTDIQTRLQRFFPGKTVLVESVENLKNMQYVATRNFRNGVMTVGIVVLFIALMGLIGYVSDEVNRRHKEIAIRKVNGACVGDVMRIFQLNILRTAIPAVLIGAVGAYWVAAQWLPLYDNRIALTVWPFLVTIILVLLIMGVLYAAIYVMIATFTIKIKGKRLNLGGFGVPYITKPFMGIPNNSGDVEFAPALASPKSNNAKDTLETGESTSVRDEDSDAYPAPEKTVPAQPALAEPVAADTALEQPVIAEPVTAEPVSVNPESLPEQPLVQTEPVNESTAQPSQPVIPSPGAYPETYPEDIAAPNPAYPPQGYAQNPYGYQAPGYPEAYPAYPEYRPEYGGGYNPQLYGYQGNAYGYPAAYNPAAMPQANPAVQNFSAPQPPVVPPENPSEPDSRPRPQ
ncbi:ABC transporter permease [uncultured Mobiluncus sp.]|uniref:ABC transporter permease n=1 Tax=uncultured Mobiluncus sp. TaxID=293425 RepID=UPI0026346126|nr:FtsX-like permease family protein [uncultured Mobiluncus sp.]